MHSQSASHTDMHASQGSQGTGLASDERRHENRLMRVMRFQYRLWSLHVVVACVALVLGAGLGGLARHALVVSGVLFIALMATGFLGVCAVITCYGAVVATRSGFGIVLIPTLARQAAFEWRLARIRPGNPSHLVRRKLGAPARVDGFGDRLYWSYRIAGRRYTVSFDPRRLVAKYSNGLARDLPAHVLSPPPRWGKGAGGR
jgi:hypothetical protein